jgi:hypothetical protein
MVVSVLSGSMSGPTKYTVSLNLANDQPDAQFFILFYVYYSPLHVSSNVVLIIRRLNCTNTASGIVTLCKWPSGMQVEKFLLGLHTGLPLTESDYTRCRINTIDPLMMSTYLLETCRGLE